MSRFFRRSFLTVIVVFISYFIFIHLMVYGYNYTVLLTNLSIVFEHPECTRSFLSTDELERKFSYKLLSWVDDNKFNGINSRNRNRGFDPATRTNRIMLPVALVSEYIKAGENISITMKNVKCEFSQIRIYKKDGQSPGILFSYMYYFDLLGPRRADIAVSVDNNGVITSVPYYFLSWR